MTDQRIKANAVRRLYRAYKPENAYALGVYERGMQHYMRRGSVPDHRDTDYLAGARIRARIDRAEIALRSIGLTHIFDCGTVVVRPYRPITLRGAPVEVIYR
jgi:hypothetical protein